MESSALILSLLRISLVGLALVFSSYVLRPPTIRQNLNHTRVRWRPSGKPGTNIRSGTICLPSSSSFLMWKLCLFFHGLP